jgi:hypothetical protein
MAEPNLHLESYLQKNLKIIVFNFAVKERAREKRLELMLRTSYLLWRGGLAGRYGVCFSLQVRDNT